MSASTDGPNRRRALIALGAVWLATTGMTRQELTAAQKKLLAAHYSNDDPAWALLATSAITEDKERGLLKAAFSTDVQAMRDKPFKITGFMMALDTGRRTRHFIVTRRSTTCPFCPPNAPTEAVEVITDSPVAVTEEEIAVSGSLVLIPSSDAGLFYGLSHAVCGLSPRGARTVAAGR